MKQWELETPEIDLFSDGGADPNPGNGGFGVILRYNGKSKEFSQGYRLTTNNRMELHGVIHGLECLKTKSKVNVFTDSQYVVNGIEKGWALKWKSNNWYRTKGKLASNYDLWAKLLELMEEHEYVKFNWVKGHNGHYENERCDELASIALNSNDLIEDEGFDGIETEELTSTSNSIRPKQVKIESEGDPCRKCGTPVRKKNPTKRKKKENQEYYFEYYLFCDSCKTMYMVEGAKRFFDNSESNKLFE